MCAKISKKFDIHCHIFSEVGPLRHNGTFYLLPHEALDMFEKTNVAKGLILPEVHYECTSVQRVEEVEEIVKNNPDSFYYFMNLSPRSFYINPEADYSPLIEYHLERGALGVGEMCEAHHFYDPLMDNLLFYVNKYKLPFIFHMTRREFNDYGIIDDEELNGLERALQKWKDITFLGHSADFWAEISGDEFHRSYPEGKVLPGGRVVELMRKYPNLCGDLSAGSGYNAIARDREFGIQFLTEFQDRLYFGQDVCSPKDEPKLSAYLDELLLSGELSQEVYDKICWKNAVKLLKLPLTEKDFAI